MSSIDQVIERARQPGSFAERKQFTVARQRALQKMRKFALAHPAYYIVELIQAAIANEATYVDIVIERSSVILSYVGGSFSEDQLAQLFDFLFASKESLELADVRQLALGVNALLLAEPKEVVIESGDGTLEGTTRVQIDARKNQVEVGTPTQPLDGTFLRAEGLSRSILGHGLQGLMELDVIEQRCLAAPVPIIVNTAPLFGYSSQRTPSLFGCTRQISFDEGDLYGTLGLSAYDGESRDIKLLTWGCLVQTVREQIVERVPIGGVVCYDRLHKTADHSAIVHDDRYKEMWARLLPYARQLAEGRSGEATFDVSLLTGERLSAADLRRIIRDSGGAVVVPRFDGPDSARRSRVAAAYGEALDLPILVRGEERLETLRMLAGSKATILEPDLDDAAELQFYRQPVAEPPERPWLTGEMQLEPIAVKELAARLGREGFLSPKPADAKAQQRWLIERLGATASIRGTVYTPADARGDADLWVEVRSLDRLLWQGGVRSPYPGHVLVVHAPELSPKVLLGEASISTRQDDEVTSGDARVLAAILAVGMARVALPTLQAATGRVLASLAHSSTTASTAFSRIALAALARSAIKRLRTEPDGSRRVRFSLLDPALPEGLLDVPLFETLDGTPRSARDLETLMDETGGLVYGVVPEVAPDLEGLYPPRILNLDLGRERTLIALLGEASYVRVDCRDVLAEHRGLRCRDMAIGVRAFGSFPLLVEGDVDLDRWSEAERREAVNALLEQLLNLFRDTAADTELRRQAARHLLWYLYFEHAHGDPSQIPRAVREAPLFLTVDGRPRSFADLEAALFDDRGLVMHDGWGVDTANLGALTRPRATARAPAEPVRDLAMNPFVFSVLDRIGKISPALDVDLSHAEAEVNDGSPDVAFLAEATIREPFVEGVVGIPMEPVERPVVVVFDRNDQRVSVLTGPVSELGVVGRLEVKRSGAPEDAAYVEGLVVRAALGVYDTLTARIPTLDVDSPLYARSLEVCLRFARRALSMTAGPDGRVSLDVYHPEAQRILELPLFPTTDGVALSAQRLITQWLDWRSEGRPGEFQTHLAPDAPPVLADWLERVLDERRVVSPARIESGAAPELHVSAPETTDLDLLAAWLTETIATLRPDDMGRKNPTRVVFATTRKGERVPRVRGTPIPALRATDLHLFCHLGGQPHLVLNGDHWLSRRVLERGRDDAEAALWLLLACYAHINDMLEPVTNEHELEFHERIIDVIERRELPLAPHS